MAATAQLNVRLDPELKKAGDEALASIGLTPSQAIRALWERAAERGEGLEKVEALATDAPSQNERPKNGIGEFCKALDEHLEALGIDMSKPSGLSDDELMELAYIDLLQERGLM